jgi:hypothetical protein
MPRESVSALIPLKSVASNILYTFYDYRMRAEPPSMDQPALPAQRQSPR